MGKTTEKKPEEPKFLEVYELADGSYSMIRVYEHNVNRVRSTSYDPVVEQYLIKLITNVNKITNPHDRKKQLTDGLDDILGP
jgi:hypothetical protein